MEYIQKRLFVFALALFGLLVLVFVFAGITGNVIRNDVGTIGVILPLTGNASVYGLNAQRAIELAASERNINVVYKDSQCDSKKAIIGLQELRRDYDIIGIIGDLCSQSTISMIAAAEGKITIISPGASDSNVKGDNFFRTVPEDELENAFEADRIITRQDLNYTIEARQTSEFRMKYQSRYNVRPGAFASQAYDAFDAIVRAQSNDKFSSLHGLNFQGASGVISFDSNGNLLNMYNMYKKLE